MNWATRRRRFTRVSTGNTLIVDRGDPQAAYEALSETRSVTRREGERLFFRPASRFDLIRQIIRRYGFLPYHTAAGAG